MGKAFNVDHELSVQSAHSLQPARLGTGQRSVGVRSGSRSLSYGLAQGHVATLLGDPNQPRRAEGGGGTE